MKLIYLRTSDNLKGDKIAISTKNCGLMKLLNLRIVDNLKTVKIAASTYTKKTWNKETT